MKFVDDDDDDDNAAMFYQIKWEAKVTNLDDQ